MVQKQYQVCNHCVMDTTDTNITFNEHGICVRCDEYQQRIFGWWNHGKGHEEELQKLLDNVKKSGEGKLYDCILGLSGGLNSSYLLHLAVKEFGLRPFVFHVDAGWDLPVAVTNIHKLCDKLDVKLHIETMDFEDMR
ncbi:MAG: phosphoadenosine phosphosulfate reductase family protein [Christensenellaceae bacterium]